MKWTVSLDGGPRRVNHAACAVGDAIYSFGGYCSGEDYVIHRNLDIHILNTHTNRWRLLDTRQECPIVPFQRYGHTVVPLDSKIYLWGGRSDEHSCNQVFIFDTNTMLWSSPSIKGYIPEARDGHSACVIDRKMYIFAGYLQYSLCYTQEVHFLDMDTLEWKQLSFMKGEHPQFRDFHTALPYHGKMYVWGGREATYNRYMAGNEEYGSDIYSLDVLTGFWEKVCCYGDIPIGRRSHSAVWFCDKMYIFGGYNNKKLQHYNDFYQFDPETKNWTKLNPIGVGPKPRRRHVCCTVGTKMFFFGGTSPSENFDLESISDINDREERGLMDHDDLHVLDMCPSLLTLTLLEVIKLKIEPPWLPQQLKAFIKFMTLPNNIVRPLNHTG